MGRGRTLSLLAALMLTSADLPCVAQGVPTPQDTLENNLNTLRGPSPGAPQRVGVPTPQQSLDGNIGGLRSSGPIRNAPTPQYYPPSHDRHPGADALLSPTGARVAPAYGGHRHKTRAGRRKARLR